MAVAEAYPNTRPENPMSFYNIVVKMRYMIRVACENQTWVACRLRK
jgi:hypothetical protein